MIIYHGGTERIEEPRIILSVAGRDFGSGFYLTGIRSQAEKWARRQARIRKKSAVVNAYEFDENEASKNLQMLRFTDYSIDWLNLVLACRQQAEYRHGYDIVFGKIANDDVGETVQAVLDGLMPKDFALQRLSFMKANEQYCFCTDTAITYLHYREDQRLS
jgi:hypothetical protein